MIQYHKIQTIYFRDPETNYKTLLEGVWSKPEFNYLKNNDWLWTEKIHGTNIRIMFDGFKVRFGGKTDSAQIPTNLLEYLQDTFTVERMLQAFPDRMNRKDGGENLPYQICLYGEGYGAKIQKGGGRYISDGAEFILFDVNINNWWLLRDNCEDIASILGIKIVPIIGTGTLLNAIEVCRTGFKSVIAEDSTYDAEGLVVRPIVELTNRNGERVISKIKLKDFHHV